MSENLKARRGHYTPEPRKVIQLTARDLQILEAVRRYRFLTSRHIKGLIEGSDQQLLKRLRDLMDAGYLMPIRNPKVRRQNGGSHAKIYGITNLGVGVLASEGLIDQDSTNWNRKNAEVNDPTTGKGIKTIPHTLLISDIISEIEIFARRSEGQVRYIDQAEILARSPQTTSRLRNPFEWHVTTRYPMRKRLPSGELDMSVGQKSTGVTPDWVFGLEFSSKPPGRNRLFYFLEADTGHMPIRRSDLEKTSIFRKLWGYSGTWAQELLKARFGLANFQVLIITRSETRVNNMVRAFGQLDKQVMSVWSKRCQPWVFQFADRASGQTDKLLGYRWSNGRGAKLPLTGIPEDL